MTSQEEKTQGGALIAKEENQLVPQQDTPEALIARAIDKGVDVGTMERLLALRKELKDEFAREAFNAAMSAFQAECPIIKKTKSVKTKAGIIAYSFAPIESVVEQVKELLQKHGFRYSTSMELKEGQVKATCHVVHKLGHTEESSMEVPLGTKTDIMSQTQVVAAAQTFAKRYAFLNAFGIMTGDADVDGATIGKEDGKDDKATTAQKNEIDTLCAAIGWTKADLTTKFRTKYGISYSEMTSTQAEGVLTGLRALKK